MNVHEICEHASALATPAEVIEFGAAMRETNGFDLSKQAREAIADVLMIRGSELDCAGATYDALYGSPDDPFDLGSDEETGPVITPGNPRSVAREFVKAVYDKKLLAWGGDFYFYAGNHWRAGQVWKAADTEVMRVLWDWLATCSVLDSAGEPYQFKPNPKHVAAVYAALPAVVGFRGDRNCHIKTGERTALVPVQNGMVDPATGALHPLDPAWFVTHCLAVDWDPDTDVAGSEFLPFIKGAFGEEQLATIQQIMGIILFGDRSFEKAMLLIGPPRSGKGTLLGILEALLGATAVSVGSRDFSNQFGLQHLIDARLASIPDQRMDAHSDYSALAERVLSIVGQDTVPIQRKFLSPWVGRLDVFIAFFSNGLPRLRDAQGVLASRFIYLRTLTSHRGREDIGLKKRLLEPKELQAAAVFALEGYQIALAQGKISTSAEHDKLSDRAHALQAPAAAFLARYTVPDPNGFIPTRELAAVWMAWGQEVGLGEFSIRAIGRALHEERDDRCQMRRTVTTRLKVGKRVVKNSRRRRGYVGMSWKKICDARGNFRRGRIIF